MQGISSAYLRLEPFHYWSPLLIHYQPTFSHSNRAVRCSVVQWSAENYICALVQCNAAMNGVTVVQFSSVQCCAGEYGVKQTGHVFYGHDITTIKCSAVQYNAIQVQYTTVQYTTSRFSRYTTLQYTTLQYPTLQKTTLMQSTPHYSTPHYSRVHYSTVHHTTVHHTTVEYTTVQYTTLQYTTLQ